MLEGVVARLLNRWLGNYVLDLDTENLNVGIFSGHVQLTDLRLKPEALYELDLPIQINFGTIGKISIQIPWNALLNQSVVIHIEDVHILAGPIITNTPFDADKEKRLTRAAKRKTLSDLYSDGELIGGPELFSEHLISNIINNFQVVIQNVHIRYEDKVSIPEKPLAAGICISSITAETTNNKWKASNTPKGCPTGYHLLKIESFSVYWNHVCESKTWDWKTQYYLWRNAMSNSLQTFSMNGIDFDFLIKPMTCKIKFIINKSNGAQTLKLLVDMVLQDFTIQISREQYLSINSVIESLNRMRTSRYFLCIRPMKDNSISKTTASVWWKYAHEAILEQRIRPYTWSRIAKVRANYRLYRDVYKKVLVNPNDTELKLDLQKYEDNLSLINIVIAREHAKLLLEQEQSEFENSPLEKCKNLWSMLPSPERSHLCQLIGFIDNDTHATCHYIEHKYNITISNFSLSLLHDNKEVFVTTLTQVLASAETQSTGNFVGWNKFLKFSARAEGFVIEGASLEDHLVPLISAQHHCSNGSSSITQNVFSMDYESNPTGSNANCKLWCNLEAIEITFHTFAIGEMLKFFDNTTTLTNIPTNFNSYKKFITDSIKKLLCCILSNRVDLNLDIKIPYFIIPEYGSTNKSGNILIVDFGRMVIRTELTQSLENLEEATQMELEERAYSRVHIDLFHAQVLFCDSSENWRDARKETDTDMHLISKINTLIVFALCTNPDHKTLPKHKLNITVPSFKINISERKIGLFLNYLEHLELVLTPHYNKFKPLGLGTESLKWQADAIVVNWRLDLLKHIRKIVSEIRIGKKLSLGVNVGDVRRASDLSAMTDRSVEPSDYSEESVEAWARCVDLPGLEDNVSPHNTIQNLLRIVIGEVCFVLSRSSERIDRPYLMLRVGKCCLDLANMDYGPALQLTVASISLTDKLHTNITGQYLDLIHVPVPSEQDFLMLLYRKVRADCPDFRSHFHSVEKSLVADFGPVNFLIHRDAIRALVKYGQYLYNKMSKHQSHIISYMYKKTLNMYEDIVHPRGNVIDPPVPAGAVKFSHSARATLVTVRLCDADRDLFEIRIGGLECDFMFRANERLVLRAYLSSLQVDHLTDVTLYTKVLTSDEEKVFEIKYVRHAPRLYTSNAAVVDIAASSLQDDVNSDGSVRVNVGRLQVTLLYKLILQLKHFCRPLLECKGHRLAVAWLKGTCEKTLRSSAKIHLAITVHGPTLLLPQKTASPNLIVIHTGELTVENFFKESPPTKSIVIENILLKLEGTTIFRAVMTLASNLEMQEAILEPMSIRLDIKRVLTTGGANTYNAATMTRAPSWEIDGIFDVVKFTLGQRDLTTLLAVYTDNINEGHFVEFSPDLGNCTIEMNQLYSPPPLNNDDQAVKCLQAFLCQVESKHKDVCVKINVEGVLLSLFCDCDEVLSSPVRDLNHGLCRLEIGDTVFSSDLYTDSSLEAKLSIQGVTVVDIRPDINTGNNIIFQSHRDETKANTYQISVSTPPVIDVSFHQNNMGDKFIDVIIERICLTLSVPFLATLGRFVFESMPCDRRHEGGIVNPGYIADTNASIDEQNQNITPQQLTEQDPQEFHQDTNIPGLTIAIRMCKPECIILSDAQIEKGNVFTIKAEILVDYSRHALRENLIVSLSNLHVLFNAMHHNEPYILLHPCDFEFSKNFKIEDGIKSTLTVSSLQIHFCAAICLTCTDILEDIYLHLNATVDVKPKQYLPYMNRSQEKCDDDLEDLWSPKRLSQCYVTEQEMLMRDLNVENDENLVLLNNHMEMFIGSISSITIVFEMESAATGVNTSTSVVPAISTQPIILVQASFETTIHDWSRQLHGTVEFHLQANYYNDQIESWEPLIEPIACTEGSYRPWECFIKIFQSSATPMNDNFNQQKETTTRVAARSNSSSGDEDTSSDGGMVFLRPQNSNIGDKATPRIQTSLAAFLEDTDSETEDGTMEKLASAICDLFTGDWNESEDSDCGHSSETDESGGSDSDHHKRKTRSGSTGLFTDQLVTFVLIDSRDTLNITLTSQTIQLLHDIIVAYTDRTAISSVICGAGKTISLVNDIGPKSKVELIKKNDQDNIVLCSKTFEKVDSGPSSPAKSVEDLSAEESINSICSDVRLYPTEADWQQDKDMLQSLYFPEVTTSAIYKMVNEEQLCVQVPGFSPLYASCPRRTWQKLIRLQPALHNTKYHLVAKHDINRSGRNLIVRSPLQLCNETCYPIGVFYEKSILSEMGLETVGEIMNPFEDTVRVTVLEPHDIYNVPLHIAYHCKLFLQPAYTECHQLSNIGLWWPEMLTDLNTARDIYCEPKNVEENSTSQVFSLRVQMVEQEMNESLSRQQTRTIPNYLIRLLPPFIVHNCLPYSIEIKIANSDQQIHVDAGDKTTLYTLNMQRTVKFNVELNYLGLLWTSSLNLSSDLDEKALSMVTDFDTEGGNKQLTINVRVDRTNSRELFFYSPYWIVNKTGLPLQIKGSVSNIVYDSQGEETLLFSYKRQARQTVRIRAYQSSWSAEFSLDAVGSAGLVIARDKERNRRYPVLLSITLSKMCPRFTKIITLLPNFLVHNNTKKHLRFMEENESTDLWLDLTPGQCVPFWPETQSMQMYVKYRDSKVVSQNFSIATVHQIVLRMDKGSAVSVQVSGGRTEPFCIKFTGYRVGDAPCRVDNMCSDLHLKVNQHGQGQVTLISPQHSLLYTWDDPCADRILVWNVYNNKGVGFPLDIRTDGYGEVRIRLHTVKPGSIVPSPPAVQASSTAAAVSSSSDSDDSSSEEQQQTSAQLTKKSMRRDKVVVYWLCYMDGPQRTVMFTQDHRLATQYRRRAHFDYCEWEVCLSLSGIGVSMCLMQPTKTPLEFAYFTLVDSPALWEVNIAHKWKMLTLELAAWVEDKYKTQQKKCQLKDYVYIDFEKMYMLKPFYGELRRTYYPALWLQYRKSEINQFYRLKVNSFQIESEPQENQQFKILYPLTSHLPKPFGVSCIEFSCFKRHYPLHEYDTYKFITLDAQEFCANIDRLFVERLYRMFHVWIAPNDPGMNIRQDMALVHVSLASLVQQCSNNKKKTIIERLRFSPIAIQLNLSTNNQNTIGPKNYNNNNNNNNNKICDTLKYLFNSLDLSYVPIKQAKYNLTSFELENISTNISQLYTDIWNHYKTQFLQQFHVHVLGQEVLLNPYGVNALIQNTATHNNELDLSMAGTEIERTCRCLMGHVHGSQSLLTAILGRDYPFVHSLDTDYKRRKKYGAPHITNMFPETLGLVSRTFLIGVTLGFCGVSLTSNIGVTSQFNGVESFFRGNGKALASLMTRGGVSDCVDVANDAIRRAVLMGERINIRNRLHRYIHAQLSLKPFSLYESMGQNLLMMISNGRYAKTNTYWAHAPLNNTGKLLLLITLEQIFLVENCRQWSTWDIEWSVDLDDIVSVPKIIANEIVINLRQDDLKQQNSVEKFVVRGQPEILSWLKEKIEQAIVISMENKCWTSINEH